MYLNLVNNISTSDVLGLTLTLDVFKYRQNWLTVKDNKD